MSASGRSPRRSGVGVTLVEFLFAVSITAVAALGVAGMFPAALRSVVAGGHTTKATALASSFADMVRAEPFDRRLSRYGSFDTSRYVFTRPYSCPVALPGTDAEYDRMRMRCDVSWDSPQATGRGLPGGSAAVAVTCVNADGTANSGSPCPTDLQRITVTVSWERGARSSRLVTYAGR